MYKNKKEPEAAIGIAKVFIAVFLFLIFIFPILSARAGSGAIKNSNIVNSISDSLYSGFRKTENTVLNFFSPLPSSKKILARKVPAKNNSANTAKGVTQAVKNFYGQINTKFNSVADSLYGRYTQTTNVTLGFLLPLLNKANDVIIAEATLTPSPTVSPSPSSTPTSTILVAPTATPLSASVSPLPSPTGNISGIESSSLVANHTLFRRANSNNIYFFKDGLLHLIPDTPTLKSLGFSQGDVFEISTDTFFLFKIGDPIETVINPFSDKQTSAIRSLFKKFIDEERVVSIVNNIAGDLSDLKDIIRRGVPVQIQGTSGGGGGNPSVGSTTTSITGNSLTVTSGNITTLTVGTFSATTNASHSFSGDLEITGNNLKINGVLYGWPSADGSSGQFLKTNGAGTLSWATASGGSSTGTVHLASSSADLDTSVNPSIFINDTGGGRFVRFQSSGTDKFYISNAGDVIASGAFNFAKGNTASVSYSRFGTGITTHVLSANNDLLVSGKLEVDGTTYFDGTVNFPSIASASLFYAQPGTTSSPSFSFAKDQDTGMWNPAQETLAFSTLGLERLRIDSNGNVGIGTTVPTNKLHLRGTGGELIEFDQGGGSSGWIRFISSTVKGYFGFSNSGTLLTTGLSNQMVLRSEAGIAFGTNGDNPRIVIDTNGKIGMGTTSPKGELSIVDSGPGSTASGSFSIRSSNTLGSVASISATSLTSGNLFQLTIPASTSFGGRAISLQDTAGNNMFVLKPNGDILNRGALNAALGNAATKSYNRFGNLTTNHTNYISTSNDLFVSGNFDTKGSASFAGTASLSNALWVSPGGYSGKVGIGTTAPSYPVDIVLPGTSGVVTRFRGTGTSGGIFVDTGTGQASFIEFGQNNGINWTLAQRGDINSRFGIYNGSSGINGTEMLTILPNGRIGLGTTSPKGELSLVDSGPGSTASGSFSIRSSNTIGSVASISATSLAGGGIFNITVPASSSANNPHGLMLVQDTTGTVIASWSMGGALAVHQLYARRAVTNCTGSNTPSQGCIDYAESYPTADSSLEAGDLVGIDAGNSPNVIKANNPETMIGIVSTNPAVVIGNSVSIGSQAKEPGFVPVALAGRVPLKVSLENGPIKVGDKLTVSSVPGIAAKATKPGMIVGISLANLDAVTTAPYEEILVFVGPQWYGGELQEFSTVSSSGNGLVQLSSGTMFDVDTLFANIVQRFEKVLNIIFKDGLIKVANIITDSLTAKNVSTDTLQVKNGIELKDTATGDIYCVRIVNGEWQKTKGNCNLPSLPVETPVPTPILTPSDTPMSTPSITPSPTPEASQVVAPTPNESPNPNTTPTPESSLAPSPTTGSPMPVSTP